MNTILRPYTFQVQGDGVGNVLTIDLREQLETKDTIGQGSPVGIDRISLVSNGPLTPAAPAISFATIQNFILTVTLAAALFTQSFAGGDGFSLNVTFQCPGAV
jgi:hypothetical protein